jgi:hypothetical protein
MVLCYEKFKVQGSKFKVQSSKLGVCPSGLFMFYGWADRPMSNCFLKSSVKEFMVSV